MATMQLCRRTEGIGGAYLAPTVVEEFEVHTASEVAEITSRPMVNGYFYRVLPDDNE